MVKTIDEESWNRFPEAKLRMRENGLKTLLEGLGENGFCSASPPRINYVDDGVYIEILLNVGKHGSVIALPLEVFIQAKLPVIKKKPAKEKKANEVKIPTEGDAASVVIDSELHEPETSTGPASSDDRV